MVAENPFHSLVRILGGVVLMQGKLGHQVLGQMLIAGSHEVTIAGASLVIAATAREKNAVGQAVIRTLAPAIAIHALTRRDEARIDAAREDFERRVREFEKSQSGLEVQRAQVTSLHARLKKHKADVDAQDGMVTAQHLSLREDADQLAIKRRQLTRATQLHTRRSREHDDRVAMFDQQRRELEEQLVSYRSQLADKAADLADVENKNRLLEQQLKELSAKLRHQSTKRSAKTAAKRPRPRNKKS